MTDATPDEHHRRPSLSAAGLDRSDSCGLSGGTGRPSYAPALSGRLASLGVPVFACTPDQFPDLMATALRREDVHSWAATNDIKLIRADS
ncbi:MAG: hypothetical protein ABI668_09905 [Sphingorhabdus sp.]